ncbi:MAG: agmatinase family protein [Bacteroidales bacterium]
MENFNADSVGVDNGRYFGLPYNIDESSLILISMPWDVTASYKGGTSRGPKSIMKASLQIDLHDENVPFAWRKKISTFSGDESIYRRNDIARKKALRVINALERDAEPDENDIKDVNEACRLMNDRVYEEAKTFIKKDKFVGLVGGDHSVSLGLIKALSEQCEEFGVLHFDAHADLRESYEGFTYSHASIMYNVLKDIPQVKRLVQVGVRDFCNAEEEIIKKDNRVETFTNAHLRKKLFNGQTWNNICDQIIDRLPENIYISLDIDGLSQDYCPNTGTPVPGGISFDEIDYFLIKLANSRKNIIGFDLVEVAPSDFGEWDANVGARLLYKLSLYSILNNEK